MIPEHESSQGHAERRYKRRQNALVDGLAGFETLDRARAIRGLLWNSAQLDTDVLSISTQ